MPASNEYSPYLIIGKLSRDFILTSEGNDINDVPGGHLLYSAIGMTPWERHPALIARISKNFPNEFLDLLNKYEYSTLGIKRTDGDFEQRNFISYFEDKDSGNKLQQSVLSQYFKAGKPFPKKMLGYNRSDNRSDSLTGRTAETILARDIPPIYQEARCVHLCPMDYLSHNLLPQAFSGLERRTVTIHAGNGYMHPFFYDAIKALVNGLTSFIVREPYLKSLFAEKYRINDLADMMKILLDYGAENIVVKRNDRSFWFINRADRAIKKISFEQNEKKEKIGELSCFCGAYIVGINETYDYRKAVAYGTARTSLLKNEINPYNNLNIFSDLVMEKIRIMENNIEG